jgi:hypothetical protein
LKNPKSLVLVAIPFQFAAAHALGYGLATHAIAPGSMQVAAILLGNTTGICAIGLLAERLLDFPHARNTLRATATAVACIIGWLLVSRLPTHVYNALALPIILGVISFHMPSLYAAVRSPTAARD